MTEPTKPRRLSLSLWIVLISGSVTMAYLFFNAAEARRGENPWGEGIEVSSGVTTALTARLTAFLEGRGLGSDLNGTPRCSWSCDGRQNAMDCTVVTPEAVVCGVTCTTEGCAWAEDCKL